MSRNLLVRPWSRLRRQLLALVAVGLASLAGYLVASVNARASSTFTLSPTSVAGDLEIGSSTYATVRDAVNTAVNNSSALTLPVPIPDLQQLSVSGVSVASDDSKHSLAIGGTITLQSASVDLQLSAVWPDGTSTSPQLALAIKPSASSLSSLNALWSSAPVDPTLTSALVVASPSASYTFDPTALPTAAQSFYPGDLGTLPVGHGMSLLATVDAGSDPNFSNALHFLGEGTTVSIRGTASGSIAPLFGGASQDQEKGLDLSISDSAVGSSLPSWITSRDSSVELQITTSGTDVTRSVQINDSIGVDLNGQQNTYVGSASYTGSTFGGSTVDLTYGLQPNTTLEAPFDLGALQLSSPQIHLSMTTGDTPSFSGSFDVDATVTSKTFHVAAALSVAGGGSVQASLALTGSVSTADVVDFANSLLFGAGSTSAVDASSLGDAVTLTGVTFSFSKDSGSQSFGVEASATIRSTLDADVVLTIEHQTGSATKLLAGLHLSDPSCSCVKVSDLFGGQLSSLAQGLQFPAVDVLAEIGFGTAGQPTDVDTSTLPSSVGDFLQKVYGTLPGSITLQPGLDFAGKVALPDAITSVFGMQSGAQVLISGDVGVDLGAFAGSGAPALSGSVTAQLPTMTANLPSWLGGAASVNWSATLSADSSKTVQLSVHADSDITATVAGKSYDVSVAGDISTGTGGTKLSLTGTVTGTFDNLFGISWLSLTDPSVALSYDTSVKPSAFTASLDGIIGIGGKNAHVSADISTGDGTDAAVEVSLLDPVSLSDVASAFSADLSGLSDLPSVTITALDARFAAGSKGVSFDLDAHTTLTVHSGSSIDSTLLVSVRKDNAGTKLLAGFSATSDAKLSDLVSSLPSGVDFSFPHFAAVLSHPAQTLTPSTMTPDQAAFFQDFCGNPESPCHGSLQLADGLSIVAATNIPSSLTGLLDQVHVDPSAPVLVTGVLPVFGGDLSTFSLTVSLPEIPATGSIPDFFQSGGFSLSITSSSLTLNGNVTFNIPKGSSVSTQGDCEALSGVWRTPRGGGDAACYDQVPFDVSAAMGLTPTPNMTITGGLHQGAQWVAPMGLSWLTLNDATVQFGISLDGPTVTFTLGFDIGFTVAGHDFFGAFLASATPLEAPPFIAINPMGLRVHSDSGISLQDLVDVGNAVTGESFTLGGVPNLAIRKIDFSYSEVNDSALCLTQGVHVAADLYINPSGTDSPPGGGCPTDPSTETSRAQQCQDDASNGCFAAADFAIDDSGIRASASLGAFDVGPIDFGGAMVDLTLSPTVQRLVLKGSMSIQGFASGSVDLLVSDSNLHFRGSVQVLGSAFDAYLDGDASYSLTNLTSLKNPPSFNVTAVLKSDFLNQAGVAISGPLQALRPAIQAIDVVLGDVANGDTLGAMIDLPAQIANLGVSLPAPYGTTLADISSKLSDIKSAIDTFGHSVSWGVNELLNGFTLSFPGLPGTYVPSSPTCITTWQDGTCYSIPPVCFGILGCTDGVPGYIAYPTCITTVVDGTCYSIPPITGVHIPGLCDSIKSLVPQIYNSSTGECDVNLLVPNLIQPALKAAFKAVTGYDMGSLSLTTVLDDITNALGSGNVFAINCAQFSAAVQAGSSPSASVSLATDVSLFGNDYNFGIGWDFSPNVSSAGSAVVDILKSIISPNTNVSCGLPADWNTNQDYPDATGTAPVSDNGNTPPPPPTMTLAASPRAIDEGSSGTVNGVITPAPPTGTQVSVDWGDGSAAVTVSTASDGSFSASKTFVNNVPVGHAAAQYVVKAAQGTTGPKASAMLTVANVAPSNLQLSATPSPVNEGSATQLSGSFSDPGSADVHTVKIHWGDGGNDTVSLAAGVTTFSAAHTYLDNNGTNTGYTATVTVYDDDLASATATKLIAVDNVAPGNISITPTSCVVANGAVPCAGLGDAQENAVVTYHVTFTDPGVNDTETAVIDWGDGHTDTVSAGTNRSFDASHQWSEADANPHSNGEDPSKGVFPISVTITDKDGGVGSGAGSETVENVVPNGLTETLSTTSSNEGDPAVTVYGVFTDASGADTHTVSIDWGTGWGAQRYQTLVLAAGVFNYQASRQYGDNGTYPIAVTVSDDDGASVATSQTLHVYNVNPTSTIDRSATVSVKGVPTFLGHAGHSLTLSQGSTDPGSDDLRVTWNWGDGTATTSTSYLNAPPATDPALSPQVNPRSITDTHPHTWQNPCTYTMGTTVRDDDSGQATDAANLVITGNTSKRWGAGYWASQYSLGGSQKISTPTLNCYLAISRYMSTVLGVSDPLSTWSDSLAVLQPSSSDAGAKLERELLTLWLDFANGAFDWNTMVDTNFDGIPDTPFHAMMSTAEQVRLNPGSTQQQMLDQRAILANLVGD